MGASNQRPLTCEANRGEARNGRNTGNSTKNRIKASRRFAKSDVTRGLLGTRNPPGAQEGWGQSCDLQGGGTPRRRGGSTSPPRRIGSRAYAPICGERSGLSHRKGARRCQAVGRSRERLVSRPRGGAAPSCAARWPGSPTAHALRLAARGGSHEQSNGARDRGFFTR